MQQVACTPTGHCRSDTAIYSNWHVPKNYTVSLDLSYRSVALSRNWSLCTIAKLRAGHVTNPDGDGSKSVIDARSVA